MNRPAPPLKIAARKEFTAEGQRKQRGRRRFIAIPFPARKLATGYARTQRLKDFEPPRRQEGHQFQKGCIRISGIGGGGGGAANRAFLAAAPVIAAILWLNLRG
jgi:hypothetical protein